VMNLKDHTIPAALIFLFAGLLLAAPCAHAEGGYIDINNPFIRKIPLAVPYFKTLVQHPRSGEKCTAGCRYHGGNAGVHGIFQAG
jgi:hypothetical protein